MPPVGVLFRTFHPESPLSGCCVDESGLLPLERPGALAELADPLQRTGTEGSNMFFIDASMSSHTNS